MSSTATSTTMSKDGNLELSSFVTQPPKAATEASSSSKKSHRLGTYDDEIRISTTPPPGKSSVDVDIESQPPSPTRDSDTPPERAVTAHNTAMEYNVRWKTAATFFSLWMAGFQDGSTGALIPYLKVRYDIGLAFVALVYISTFLGWFTAAMINVHLIGKLGMGGVLFVGSILQLTQYVLQCWQPPYPLFVIAFFIGGVGVAIQDAQTNTFNANLPRAHLLLGLGHGFYGVGALVSPLIAATIANSTPDFRYWYYFYFAAVGLAVCNLIFISVTFREVIFPPLLRKLTGKASAEDLERSDKKNSKESHKDFKAIISRKEVWIFAAYFFAYVGAEVTAGGWVVEFMIEVRKGKPSQVGYIGSAFWGGLTLGRFVLAEPTNRWGERRMVLIYTGLAIAVELVFWFVPNIVVSGVMIGLLGFLIGPFFPVGISLATKLIPRELHAGSIGFMTVLGSAGGAVFPFLTGAVASSKGVQVLQPILCALFVVQILLWLCIPRVKQPSK
ncbi:hypothetical protein TWF225_006531 [Orbilia oligospora]|nr:hypothetical protein TWF225_006531 [Orbilia oligospora]KAF3265045.1 hypothetical protein TWF217_002694 [Orbilia oligospora]KAF3268082.1 hypothetical protein TWF128_008096 [Orbilia oligospora]KAF3290108.1 hypothetical protein TWF132_007304 [Orbilia oligospora]